MLTALVMAGALGSFARLVAAQKESEQNPLPEPRYLVDRFPEKPSLAPALKIPLDPLGFSPPNSHYVSARNTFVSLDFLDEDHLLFTFHVPELIHRDPNGGEESVERRIRAVVLALPQGTVQAEALWTVHDRLRYLWPLAKGRFLLRDGNTLFEGDASLHLKPYLDFPGPIVWLGLDPARQLIATNSEEPEAQGAKPRAEADGSLPGGTQPGQDSGQPAAAATGNPDVQENRTDTVARVLRRDSGEVMFVSRTQEAAHLPIDSLGYLENLRGHGPEWLLNFRYFSGGARMLGKVASGCDPEDTFLSEKEILIEGCNDDGAGRLVAMTTDGRTLWIAQAPVTQVWPQLTVAANGSRFAWITLDTTNALDSFSTVNAQSVKEQSVTVFDAATGDIPLVSPLSPILDVGGNVAISASGRRVALIDAGAIEVFDLPAAEK